MGKEIEILAPAGSYETMEAAVCAGADAVYAGGTRFGARAYAHNFSEEELLKAIDYMHLHGKKLYLTVNTLVKENEMKELYNYLIPFYRHGLDAVIVQDMGVLAYIKEYFPELAVHASTQMTITNVRSAGLLERLGVERVVPARELSLEEIRQVADLTSLEIECFVHGALCYCYSGQCLLSSLIGGRSGNRGQCAQPCRLPYKTEGAGNLKDIMSLKDLCTIDMIPELLEAGITSFKIEGRMKQPSYVAAVTEMYRRYTDLYLKKGRSGFAVSQKDKERLLGAYQRRGYCDGYYKRHNGKDMISLERPKSIEDRDERPRGSKIQEKINGKLILSPGKSAKLILKLGNIETVTKGGVCQNAEKHPATAERLEQQIRKTGNTPFVFEDLDIQLEGEVFLPVQSLNEIRREALAGLEEKVLQNFRREITGECPETLEKRIGRKVPGSICFSVSVETMEQLQAALKWNRAGRVYIEDTLLADKKHLKSLGHLIDKSREKGIEVYFSMARIFRKEAEQQYRKIIDMIVEYADGVLIRNLESFVYLREKGYTGRVAADASLYQWNRMAADFYRKSAGDEEGISRISEMTAPLELNYRELKELGIEESELIVYGHIPVMVSAGCILKNTKGCRRKSGTLSINDRLNNKFYVKNICEYCYNVIYNTAPLYLTDQKAEIDRLHPKRLRLSFTVEDEDTAEQVLCEYESVFLQGNNPRLPETFTRGHFKRGVK